MARKQFAATRVAAPKVLPVQYVDEKLIHRAKYNPRKRSEEELKRLAMGIATFGFVTALVARQEDGELIGGHMRLDALELLLSGRYVPEDAKGNPLDVRRQTLLPNGGVPVTYVQNLSPLQVKSLNLALNKIGGEWDEAKLPGVLQDIMEEAHRMATELLIPAEYFLDLTGFQMVEIDELLKIPEPEGMTPEKTTGAPKLTLEFSSRDLRDAFKAFVGGARIENVPSGDALAQKLNVKALPLKSRSK